ncbi:cytochrome c [Uliginosibacterium sp. H3]|uniref:Cytochrome c n=1 Tax=Uliginosibacterium silvisoli TaxID=3114758 RepID=A0ABU6JZJ3_9RHOO|nr:cytochrome c [Uliginosibacterium sp. H3]
MNRWIKRGLLAICVLFVLLILTVFGAVQYGNTKMARRLDIAARPVALRDDAASIERGRYLYESRACTDCHALNGGGRTVIDDGKGMRVAGPNISPGPGNVVAHYKPEDWERSIRHGVKPDGRPALIMPSEDYNRLTDDDLAALVAYLRHMPPASGGGAVLELPVPVRALYGLGVIKDAAEKIDHSLLPQQPVVEGVNLAHGEYVANMCKGCHGDGFSGGKIPGAPPDWPAAANITPEEGSAMTHYADAEQFLAMFRSGKRPDGTAISMVMPFEALAKASDTDVRALYLYLRSVAPRPAGGR